MDDVPTKSRGKYRQLAHIGRGAYADVFLCEHIVSGEHVCLKEVDLTFRSSGERERCLNEVALLKQLPAHPNIVGLREAFWAQPNASDEVGALVLVLVLEHADIGDLEMRLNAGDSMSIDEPEARQIFSQLALGVSHLHAHHVVHRDIKSSNVFLFRSGRVVLGDFGTSKLLQQIVGSEGDIEGYELLSTIAGSPFYMSPELLEGESYGFATDIWSLGCVLYELLSGGRQAFAAPSYPAVVFRITQGEYDQLDAAVISREGQDLLIKMLRKNPHERPSIQEVLQSTWMQKEGSDVASNRLPPKDQTGLQEQQVESYIHVQPIVMLPPPAPVQAITCATRSTLQPPHPDPKKQSANSSMSLKSNRQRNHRAASPCIQLDLKLPPPPAFPLKQRFSTAPSIPSKHNIHKERGSLVTTKAPALEIQGVRIKAAARKINSS